MAVQFASSQRRLLWAAIFFSVIVDYLAILGLLWLLGIDRDRYFYAGLWAGGIWIALAVYSLLGVAKRLAWYFLFEKSDRIELAIDEMMAKGLPKPNPYYNNADEYLLEAAQSPELESDGRLWAGMMLGSMVSQRSVGPRVEAMLTAMTIEAALKRLALRQGQ